jgi:hypothetical protein
VDGQGNIFVGQGLKPSGVNFPSNLDTVLVNQGSESLYWWAEQMYGSLVKYDNSGTKVWEYFGQSPFLSKHNPPNGTHCICNVGRFDVDPFGRVFVNDAFQLAVVVLDNNKNEILRFNHKSMPVGKLPAAWPHAVEATDRAFYIADQINDQVICINIGAEAADTLDLPIGIEQGPNGGITAAVFDARPNPFTTKTTFTVNGVVAGGVETLRPGVDNYGRTGRNVSTTHPHLAIYNIHGKLIADFNSEIRNSKSTIEWNAAALPAGVYIARLSLGGKTFVKRLTLLK